MMAPRVDRTVDRCLPARWSSPDRSLVDRVGDRKRPGKNTEPIRTSDVRTSCHSSRVKVQPPAMASAVELVSLPAAGV